MDLIRFRKQEVYRVDKCAWFCSKRDPLWNLSNIAALPIRFNGHLFNSSEQLYQACKYGPDVECLPESATAETEPNVRKRILAAKQAMGAKMTQKCATHLIRPDWFAPQEIRIHAMLWVLELKLWSNRRTFGGELLSTKGLPIVEKSRKDPFWGAIPNSGTFVGSNVLGKLLTILRDEKFDDAIAGKFTYPEGFLL